jgi:diacylglycerol kinase family enzyme
MQDRPSSAFGPLTVIVDVTAADGSLAARVPELKAALDSRRLPYELHLASSPDQASDAARRSMKDGGRYVVSVGNDGSVQAVVNGIFEDGATITERPVLGVVGADAGCDLLRTFGLPGDVAGGVHHLAGDATYPLDLMKVTFTSARGERVTRYAHNVAEVGLGAAAHRRAARLPGRTGRGARFLGFWVALATCRPTRVRIDADTKHLETEAFNVVIGNAQYASDGLRLSPHSFPGDGVLDALVFRGPRSDAVTMLPRIFRHGDHVPDPHITELRAKIRIAVDADRPLPIVADGVDLGTTPVIFQVVPQQVLLKL